MTLELKLIADVGLVGLPNAGKSTLITALTSSRPKIAPYPFTTLEPNLGVIDGSSFMVHRLSGYNKEPNERLTIYSKRIVIADIPGLIEGASEGKGLGDLFLRHIERTKILVHLIDASHSDDPWHVYQTVRNELKAYSGDLAKKKEIIVFNKIDLLNEKDLKDKITTFTLKHKKVIPISATGNLGTRELLLEIYKRLKV